MNKTQREKLEHDLTAKLFDAITEWVKAPYPYRGTQTDEYREDGYFETLVEWTEVNVETAARIAVRHVLDALGEDEPDTREENGETQEN